jgi:hypothetical protein
MNKFNETRADNILTTLETLYVSLQEMGCGNGVLEEITSLQCRLEQDFEAMANDGNPFASDGQPDEAQEWESFDIDC